MSNTTVEMKDIYPNGPVCNDIDEHVYEATILLLSKILQFEFGDDRISLKIPNLDRDYTKLCSCISRKPMKGSPKVVAGYSSPLSRFTHHKGAQIFSVEHGADDPDELYILLPGYGWGTPAFYSTLVRFIKKRTKDNILQNSRICLLDWMGTAASSRPKWDRTLFPDHDSVAGWFIDSLYCWLEKRDFVNRKIILVGHSVGAYYVARFLTRHKLKNLSRLVLLSPCGFADIPDQYIDSKEFPLQKTTRGELMSWFLRKHITPMEILSCFGKWPLSKLLDVYSKKRTGQFYLPEESRKLIHAWLVANYAATLSVDKAYSTVFYEIRAYYPIRRFLAHISANIIEIYYGDVDWMNPMHTVLTLKDFHNQFGGQLIYGKWTRLGNLSERSPFGEGNLTYSLSPKNLENGQRMLKNIKLYGISECGHQMPLDQGDIIADSIMGDYSGCIEAIHWSGSPHID